MQLSHSFNKRHFVDPFRHMVSKARPSALPELVTSNNYSTLETMEVEIEEFEALGKPKPESRFQILLVGTRMSRDEATSKIGCPFLESSPPRSK